MLWTYLGSLLVVVSSLLVQESIAFDDDRIELCKVANVKQMLADIKARFIDEAPIHKASPDELPKFLKWIHHEDQVKRAKGVIRYFLNKHCDHECENYKQLQRSKWFHYIEGPECDESLLIKAHKLEENPDSKLEAEFNREVETLYGWADDSEIELACEKLDFNSKKCQG